MNSLTLEQRWDLLEIYFKNKHNWSEIVWKYRTKLFVAEKYQQDKYVQVYF